MPDLAVVKSNVGKMVSQGAPEHDIDGYIDSTGFTIDDVRNFKPKIANDIKLEPEKEESFQEANRRRGMEFLRGIPQGLGNRAVGFIQTATDLGESGARAIEKAIHGDNMIEPNSQSNFGGRLAAEVGKLKEKQSNLPVSEQLGIFGGEILPNITTGIGTGAKVAAMTGSKLAGAVVGNAVAGLAQSGLAPYSKAGLENRAIESGIGAGIGAVTPLAFKVAGKLVSKPASFVAEKFKPAQQQALNKVKKALQTEGKDPSAALKEMEDNGLDLIDVVDPRFRAYNEAVSNLNNKDSIRIADESLKRLNISAEKLQDEVTNLVSKNKIDPEEAGQILGRNAQKIIDAKIAARRIAAEPLYREGEKGLAKLDQVAVDNLSPEEAVQMGLRPNQTRLTLNDLLQSPIIRESIAIARSKSQEFSKSPGGKIYGNIYSKTDPIFSTEKQLVGFSKSGRIAEPAIVKDQYGVESFEGGDRGALREIGSMIEPKFKEIQKLEKPAQYEVPDHAVKVLSAVDKILNDRIGNVAQTGNTSEQAALKLAKKGLENVLDHANPTLAKARSLWKSDSEALKELSKTSIGKIAKKYTEGNIDDLTKSAQDVLKLPPIRIAQLRKQNPEGFNDLLRNSIEDRLSSDIIDQPGGFYKAIFGRKNGIELRAAIGDDRAMYQGLEKLSNVLDKRAQRARITANAIEESTKNIKIPKGKIAAAWNAIDHIVERITNSPETQKEFVRYMFTEEGKNALRQIAITPQKQTQESLINNFLTRATVLTAANSQE